MLEDIILEGIEKVYATKSTLLEITLAELRTTRLYKNGMIAWMWGKVVEKGTKLKNANQES